MVCNVCTHNYADLLSDKLDCLWLFEGLATKSERPRGEGEEELGAHVDKASCLLDVYPLF